MELLAADDPYEVAWRLWGRRLEDCPSVLAGNLMALWGALTDWVECKPGEELTAKREMVRAAREWLALDHDDREAVEGYLDYWLHDVCGYARSSEKG
jgi:hypothetical protein